MNNNLTEIICILDRSGSMGSIKDDAIGGFNTFLKEQQELPGDALMTVVLFDHEYQFLYNGINIKDVKPLDSTTFVPRGMTALYDAVGRTVNEVKARLDSIPKAYRPGKVIFVILTDGEENSSKEFIMTGIKEMIENQTKSDWQFVFLAAGQDAMLSAKNIGIASQFSTNFVATGAGMTKAYTTLSRSVSSYRMAADTNDAATAVANALKDDIE